MADVPVLVCVEGALKGQHFTVPEEGGLEIGRSSDNAIVVVDDGVSRFHASVLFDNGALWLRDAGSRNGVFVNGTRVIQHQALKIGDEVRVAQHVFHVRMETESLLPKKTPAPADTREKASNEDTTQTAEKPETPSRRWYWPFSR